MKSMKKINISPEEVKHIAKLAKLDLTTEEKTKFQTQLSNIIEFVDQLNKVDTSKASPTANVTGLTNIFREDEVTQSLTQEQVLFNTKDKYKGFFKVKAILE